MNKNCHKMESIIPDDVLAKIAVDYGTVTELWALSRTCKSLYKALNKRMYSLAKERVFKRMKEIYPVPEGDLRTIFPVMQGATDYVITGSLVWSSLIGARWKYQYIDIFYNKNKNIVHDVYNTGRLLADTHAAEYGYQQFTYTSSIYPGIGHMIQIWGNITVDRVKELVNVIAIGGHVTLEEKLEEFDIVGCSSSFNDRELFIPCPAETLFGVTRTRPMVDPSDEFSCDKRKSRINKYERRGIYFID